MTFTEDAGSLTIDKTGTYTVTGENETGTLSINESATVVIKDLTVSVITVAPSKKATVHLEGISSVGKITGSAGSGLLFCGEGSLKTESITSEGYIRILGGNYAIDSDAAAISSSRRVQILGGKFDITAKDAGIRSSGGYGQTGIQNADIDITADTCIEADRVYIAKSAGTLTGTTGIRAKSVSASCSELDLKAEKQGIEASGTVCLESGTVSIEAGNTGIRAKSVRLGESGASLDPELTVKAKTGLDTEDINSEGGKYRIEAEDTGIKADQAASEEGAFFISGKTAADIKSLETEGGEWICLAENKAFTGAVSAEDTSIYASGNAALKSNNPVLKLKGNVTAGAMLDIYEEDDESKEPVFSIKTPAAVSGMTYTSPNADTDYDYSMGEAKKLTPCLTAWTHSVDSGKLEKDDDNIFTVYTCRDCEEEFEKTACERDDYSCGGHGAADEPDEKDDPQEMDAPGEPEKPEPSVHIHSLTHFDRTEPTCEEAGNIEYFECSGCGAKFAADGSLVTDTVIPAKGHDFGDWIEDEDSRRRTCLVCGKVEWIDLPGHEHEYTYVPAREPTDTEYGCIEHYECSCGKYFDMDKEEIDEIDVLIPKVRFDYFVREAPRAWTGGNIKIRIERTYDGDSILRHFTGILIDGEAVYDYRIEKGSLVAVLPESLVETLSEGLHRVEIRFDDGYAAVTFERGKMDAEAGGDADEEAAGNAEGSAKSEKSGTVQTGDEGLRVWASCFALAASFAIGMTKRNKRKKL